MKVRLIRDVNYYVLTDADYELNFWDMKENICEHFSCKW